MVGKKVGTIRLVLDFEDKTCLKVCSNAQAHRRNIFPASRFVVNI